MGSSTALVPEATTALDRAEQVLKRFAEIKPSTLVRLLPALLQLRGSPYTLDEHYPFEPLFRTRLPKSWVLKCGRQVSKSTSLAARDILLVNAIPNYSILYVAPLFETTRRFSTKYVRPFIQDSPLRPLWTDTTTENSVLQRSFKNRNTMYFSYAGNDAERTRGISVDQVDFDEIQNMDPDHLEVIRQTASHSPWEHYVYSGTAKTVDNIQEYLWQESSKAEWMIKCQACNYENYPSIKYDFDKMIGNYTDVSEAKPGTVCAKCSRPVFPRTGRWVHANPERRWKSAGLHVPQIILPLHYTDPDKWSRILARRDGVGHTTQAAYYNEVAGESCDTGAKLVTEEQLIAAAVLNENKLEAALARRKDYTQIVLGVDWGGGGEDEVSFTKLAVLGFLPNGHVHCIYGEHLYTPHDHIAEAKRVLYIFHKFKCKWLAHDYNGAGALRETLIVQAGVGTSALLPMWYVGPMTGALIKHEPATESHPRDCFKVDKSRSLLLTCACLRFGILKFFKYDYTGNPERPGLVRDFLALVENKVRTRRASELYLIHKDPIASDDFAQAVNFGLMGQFYTMKAWPDLAQMAGLRAVTVSGRIRRHDVESDDDMIEYH